MVSSIPTLEPSKPWRLEGFYLSRLAGTPVHIEGIQIEMRNLALEVFSKFKVLDEWRSKKKKIFMEPTQTRIYR